MSLNVALNTAVSGLFANQRAISATSENIANVNTADFARREAAFFTDAIPGQYAGVDVAIARAAVDRFLQSGAYRENANAGSASVIAEALSRVEASLGAPGENISFANELDRAFAAFTTLSANPSSLAAKGEAVAALDAAFDAFARTRAAIRAEGEATDAQIGLDVERANALLEEIYRLNAVAPESDGAADLLDARLTELSKLVQIAVARNERGQVEVSVGGTVVANAGGYSAFGYAPGVPARVTLSAVDPASGALTETNADFGGSIPSGEIRGLLNLRNTELPRLDTLVAGVAGEVAVAINAAYAGNVAVGASAPVGGALLVVDANGDFSVSAAIAADPASLAIARPASGVGGANDGAGAARIADLAASSAAGEARQAVGLIGLAARTADQAARTNEAIAAEISTRASSQSGVNLDTELSNLILYQRAYTANARVIAAIDELWQSLVSLL